MRRPRTSPIFTLVASCLAAGLALVSTVRAELVPVEVSFPDQTVLSTNQPYGSSIIVADFDGDGAPDVAAASLMDSQIAWYRNLGDGTFSPANIISTTAIGPSSIVAADIDADGRLDIVSASQLDNKIAWFRNLGGAATGLFGYNPANRTANQRVISNQAEYAYGVTVADINGDGLWDVVSASFFDDKIAWYQNLGGGNFGFTSARPTANQKIISTESKAPTSVAAGDLDGDGVTDLAVTSINDRSLVWLKGGYDDEGNATFTRYVISNDQPGAYNVTIADMNKDRVPDMICAAAAGQKIAYFRNISQEQGSTEPFFAPEQVVSQTARGVTSVVAADINRDGNLDIVSALLDDDRILWFPSNGLGEDGDVTFGPEALVTSSTQGPAAVAAADFDRDGVIDVTSTSQVDSKVAVFLNAGEFNGDVTEAPTLLAPVSGTVTTRPVHISYTLPEDALPGSVVVRFVSGATTRELILAAEGESAGDHSFSFDPASPGDSSAVQSAPASIRDGTYNVSVIYQDAEGNPEVASQPAVGVVIDAVAPFLPGAATTVLAAKGTPVPGAGVDGTGIPADARYRVLGIPSINDAGHLAITASYSSGGSVRQVVLGPNSSGELAPVASVTDFAPDATGAPLRLTGFQSFLDVLLNDADSVAFVASVRGFGAVASTINSRNDTGIWTNAGDGQLRLAAREYDIVGPRNLRLGAIRSVALSPKFALGEETVERTQIAYVAKLLGTGVVAANDEALFIYEIVSTGEFTTRLALRKGQDISVRENRTKRIKLLTALPSIDGALGNGRGAVPAGVVAKLDFTDNSQAIVSVNGDGSVRVIAASNDPLPDSSDRLLRFALPTQNTVGDTLAIAALSSRTESTALILTPESGEFSLSVRAGDEADGVEGGTYAGFRTGVLNNDQSISFLGRIAGSGVSAATDDCLWHISQGSDLSAGTPVLIAREGTQAVGAPDGARWETFRSIALPDSAAGPVFLADLYVPLPGRPNPARVTANNDTGVWAVDSNGDLRLIVREGDVFPGSNLTIRAIALLGNVAVSPAQARSFNSHGELVYRATLSDGSEVIAKARVP